MPCIEYWFLLHFLGYYSTRIYKDYEEVKQELKKYLHDYDKTKNYFKKIRIYQHLKESNKLEKAIQYAKKLLVDKIQYSNTLFPFTQIHSLLKDLENIKN